MEQGPHVAAVSWLCPAQVTAENKTGEGQGASRSPHTPLSRVAAGSWWMLVVRSSAWMLPLGERTQCLLPPLLLVLLSCPRSGRCVGQLQGSGNGALSTTKMGAGGEDTGTALHSTWRTPPSRESAEEEAQKRLFGVYLFFWGGFIEYKRAPAAASSSALTLPSPRPPRPPSLLPPPPARRSLLARASRRALPIGRFVCPESPHRVVLSLLIGR